MTYTILFAASYPDLAIGYSKVAHFLSNTLAEMESVKLIYFGFSNFPGSKKIQRYIHPDITFIDVFQEETARQTGIVDYYGTNIFIDTLNRVKPDLVLIYNDIIVTSRLMNTLIEYRKKYIQNFKVYSYLDLVYDYERPEFLNHVFQNSDKVILFTDYWLNHLASMNFPKEKMAVLYHSYGSESGTQLSAKIKQKLMDRRTVDDAKRSLGLPADSFIILNANRNAYRKANDISIRAFLLFLKDQNMNPALYLLLRTSADEKTGYKLLNVIQSECIRIGLEYDHIVKHHILLIDRHNELSDANMSMLYSACDVGINTCIGEGFGLCNMEHGIAGKPQIVSNVGGLRDIFTCCQGLTDTLIEPRTSYHISNQNDEHNGVVYVCDAEDIATALRKVYTNYPLYVEQYAVFSEAARGKYAIDAVKKQLFDIVSPLVMPSKVRVGRHVYGELEGGYDCYILADVSDDESFSRDFIQKYGLNEYTCFAFNGAISHYTNRMAFIHKDIGAVSDDTHDNLEHLTTRYGNIFLKMDIKGGEYPWLMSIDENRLRAFKQIVIAFYGEESDYAKLATTHVLIHTEGIERTFIRKSSDVFDTYATKYGLVTLYKNEAFIRPSFAQGRYWEEDTLLKLREYIPPNRTILEIGGHCGTSSIVYASFLNNGEKIYVYEPQRCMFELLVQNIKQNNMQHKIIPYNTGVFCYEGRGRMHATDLDGGGGEVSKRYNEEHTLACNFGGVGFGKDGEDIRVTTIDAMSIENIGFIHCDAQGSENFIFSKGLDTITKNRPVIFYENNQLHAKYLYDNVCNSYPNYKEESVFDIKQYCMEQLKYSKCIEQFNGGIDTLLLP